MIDEIQNEQGDNLKVLKVKDIKPKIPEAQQEPVSTAQAPAAAPAPGLQNLIQKLKANAAAKLGAHKSEASAAPVESLPAVATEQPAQTQAVSAAQNGPTATTAPPVNEAPVA